MKNASKHFITLGSGIIFIILGLACASAPSPQKIEKQVQKAADAACEDLISQLPKSGTIAVLGANEFKAKSVAGSPYDYTSTCVENTEYKLVKAKYKLVDRQRLSDLKHEQQFELSGNVDDASAAQIGKLTGANIVVVVDANLRGTSDSAVLVDGKQVITHVSGPIVLKALNVETAAIIGMGRATVSVSK
jgi:hypothetical protein